MLYAVKRFVKIYFYPFLLVLIAFGIYYVIFVAMHSNKEQEVGVYAFLKKVGFLQSAPEDTKSKFDFNATGIATIDENMNNEDNTTILIGNVLVKTPTQENSKPKTIEFYTPKNAGVQLHLEADAQSPVIGVLNAADRLQKIGDENGWLFVDLQSQNLQGWTLADNLNQIDENQTQIQYPPLVVDTNIAQSGQFYTAKVASLNIRENADRGATIIGSLKQNEKAELIKEEGGWIYLQLPNKTKGWGAREYLSKVESTQSNTPKEEATTPPPPPLPVPTPLPPQVETSVESLEGKTLYQSIVPSLNIRAKPVDGAVIGKLRPQHRAIILQDNGEWVNIERLPSEQEGSVNGWVVKRSLKVIP